MGAWVADGGSFPDSASCMRSVGWRCCRRADTCMPPPAASLCVQVIDFDEKKGPGGSPGKGFPGLKGMGMGMGKASPV